MDFFVVVATVVVLSFFVFFCLFVCLFVFLGWLIYRIASQCRQNIVGKHYVDPISVPKPEGKG